MGFSHYALLLICSLALHTTTTSAEAPTNISGSAITSRYWDCCKPSCAWGDKTGRVTSVTAPVLSCDINDKPHPDSQRAGSACEDGGTAFTCSNQAPWAVNDTFSYGFSGMYISHHVEDWWCCACYELEFTSGPVQGKRMIVQATNTDYAVKTSQYRFMLAIPGGNTTVDDECARQYKMPASDFGQLGLGIMSRPECDSLPQSQRAGCHWRYDWFRNADAPNANFKRVTCPTELTSISQCTRGDDNRVGSAAPSPATPGPATHQYVMVVAATIYIALKLF